MTTADTPTIDAKAPLRTPVFRTLTIGWSLTNFADSLLMLIFGVWVADLTGSVELAGATFAAMGIPALASPFLGQLADRVSRRTILTVTYALGAVFLVPLYLVRDASDVWIVYAVTIAYATVSYVTAACQSGILKDLLPDESLGRANARFQTIDQVCRLALPFVGAAGYAWMGMVPLITAALLAFAAAAVIFGGIRLRETHLGRAREESFAGQVTAGFRHLFRTRPLGGLTRAMLVAVAITGLLNAATFAILDFLGIPAVMLGPVTVLQSLAGIAAGLLAPRLMDRFGRVRLVAGGLILLGVGIIPLAFPVIALAILGMGVVGFGVTAAVIAFMTERQIATPPELQGRTSTASHLVLNFPQVVVTVIGAAVLAVVDFRLLLALTTVTCVAMGSIAFRLRSA